MQVSTVAVAILCIGIPASAAVVAYVRVRPYRRERTFAGAVLDNWIPWRALRPDLYDEEGQRRLPKLWLAVLAQVVGLAVAAFLLR